MKSHFTVAALVAAAGAAGAIMAAPIASAEPLQPTCQDAGGNIVSGSSTVCTKPGNAQITSSPGILGATQWGMWPWFGGMGVL
ncbi:hypothetical protein [Mycolicibacterium mengxianglii]|uniref:hypothetical protein n=1 Tax=Mycolicibacterium mengxianglii TaxID=2736649 RepID=UPI0018D06ACD|nr:hypothetical protein [Mycolicibacterium mengxianglii]